MNSMLQLIQKPDWQTLGTWAGVFATIFTAVVATIVVRWQLNKQWLLHSAIMITSLSDKFNSQEMRKARIAFAKMLVEHRAGKDMVLAGNLPVLGFFETIGHLVHRKAIDKQMVWNEFSWLIVRYHDAVMIKRNLFEDIRSREQDAALYEEFEWLYRQMMSVYKSKGIIIDSKQKELRIEQLMAQEQNLNLPVLLLSKESDGIEAA